MHHFSLFLQKKSMVVSLLVTSLQLALNFSPALHNVYAKIPSDYYALFIVATKLSYTIFFALTFITMYSEEKSSTKQPEKSSSNNNQGEEVIGEGNVVSMSKALAKLSFSIYLFNYWFIRYDFFTTRLLYVLDFYNIVSGVLSRLIANRSLPPQVKRMIYTVVYTFFIALSFHLWFVGPFDSMRKNLDISVVKRPIAKDKHE